MTTRRPDRDFESAFDCNQPQPFGVADVKDVKAAIAGHNDEDYWYWIVELHDGRVFLVEACCDYTGWDCQSWCSCIEAKSAEDAARKVTEHGTNRNIRVQLLKQIRGEQSFGLEIKNHG